MTFKKALSIVSSLLLIFSIVIATLLFINYENEKNTAKLNGTHFVNLIKTIIDNDFKMVYSDILFLANLQATATSSEKLAQDFLAFSTKKGIYDQIRFLDATGMERIRVDAAIIPEKQRQFKGNRYYFKESIKLQAGEIFVSPFDLNIEHGRIEQPLKPMIRFATPVPQGIVILNYLGDNILKKLDHFSNKGQVMLVNSDGYWLKHKQSEREWGFMFKARQDEKFQNDFPEAWTQINARNSGEWMGKKGLFSFATPTDASWKIIYYVQNFLLVETSIQLFFNLLFIALPLFIFLTILLFNLENAKIKQKQSEQYIKKQNVSSLRFVPKKFLDLLGKKELIDVQLGDQTEQEMSILVLSISGFTGMSEAMTAKEKSQRIVWFYVT